MPTQQDNNNKQLFFETTRKINAYGNALVERALNAKKNQLVLSLNMADGDGPKARKARDEAFEALRDDEGVDIEVAGQFLRDFRNSTANAMREVFKEQQIHINNFERRL